MLYKIIDRARKSRNCMCSEKTLIKATFISHVIYEIDIVWNRMLENFPNKMYENWSFFKT